jgi:hypothetical protein
MELPDVLNLRYVPPAGPKPSQFHLKRRGGLNERIGDLAQELLGKPNAALSTRSQLRFGRKGSVAVELDGEKRGQWFDHEDGVGGDAMALVCNELGLANGAACA